jgi:aryl-alcohol dehydrogenase-like predicted oxidoreductase
MADDPQKRAAAGSTRRRFLQQMGRGAVAGSVAAALLSEGCSSTSAEPGEAAQPAASTPPPETTPPPERTPGTEGKVGYRPLGKTGLRISEVGFGGHSWSYKRVPDGNGEFRLVSIDEAVEMIGAGLEMGVNFLDSCTPMEEASTPGEALKRLGARDQVILSARVSHKMKGNENDRQEIYQWMEDRLEAFQTDYIDLCLLCNTENDTPQSGYWDMSYSIEALDKLKEQGKIGYTGFGCHFTPELFLEAFDKFGDYFDIVSLPYNVRHRAAETILPAAKEKNLGVITIKPFARGSLLKKKDLEGADAGLPRDMMAFVLESDLVDICTCGVHTLDQVRENFSASWTKLTPDARERLGLAACAPCAEPSHAWLEQGWLLA